MASNGADSGSRLPGEWADLELAVRRLLDEHDAMHARTAAAEARCAELETSLQQYASGSVDPVDLQQRVERLESENRDLRSRLGQASERVGRVMDRLRFAEQSR